jgi:uncharacterized protein (DUF952 family)
MIANYIYHITTAKEWEIAQQKGIYEADTLASEGYMHCSTEEQVQGVLERYYADRVNLVKLTINKEKVERPLIFELAGSINEVFPHIYGALNLDAVENVDYL